MLPLGMGKDSAIGMKKNIPPENSAIVWKNGSPAIASR